MEPTWRVHQCRLRAVLLSRPTRCGALDCRLRNKSRILKIKIFNRKGLILIIETIDIADLPESKEAAFVEYETRLRSALSDAIRQDRYDQTDGNGNYHGNHEPERYYVSSIIAFMDEYELYETELVDITALPSHEFETAYSTFFNKINYIVSRFRLRAARFASGTAGTPIQIVPNYKEEARKLLSTIRKIVEQEIKDPNKKDAIYQRISALQDEIDRDRTTVDALFSRLLDVTKVVGEAAENLEPLVEKVERLKRLFFEGLDKLPFLPKTERKKALPAPELDAEDDEIPF